MTTVAIVPIPTPTGGPAFQAVSGNRMAEGGTAGQALDALIDRFPEIDAESTFAVTICSPSRSN